MMREYAKVAPKFWTGETGKFIRSRGRDVQVLALYLLTCPMSNMLGLYYLPLPIMCHETGIPLKGASEALRSLSEGGFARYDYPSEYVYVLEMARFQLAEVIEERDNRHKALIRELETLRKCPFFNDFLQKYREPFHLHSVAPSESLRSPSEAPPKPRAGAGAGAGSGSGNPTYCADGNGALFPAAESPQAQAKISPATKRITFSEGPPAVFHGIIDEDMRAWQEAYPGCAVPIELERAALWLRDNPAKRKRNVARFITGWLNRTQEKGGTRL